MAVALCCATFPLIWIGGLVTTHDAGMAVPDWPNTFGYNLFLYPYSEWFAAPWDLFIEHGHRLLAAAVGLLTIVFVIVVWRLDKRRWMRVAALLALALVVAQGVLGGMRVLFDARTIAMIHGCVGPLFFTYCVLLATLTSQRWKETSAEKLPPSGAATAIAIALLAYVQLLLGAQLRHAGESLSPGDISRVCRFSFVCRRDPRGCDSVFGNHPPPRLELAVAAVVGACGAGAVSSSTRRRGMGCQLWLADLALGFGNSCRIHRAGEGTIAGRRDDGARGGWIVDRCRQRNDRATFVAAGRSSAGSRGFAVYECRSRRMSIQSMTVADRRASILSRAAALVELTKPRIAAMVLVTVAVAMFVGSGGRLAPIMLLHTLLGTALVAASASALNQWIERKSDALMTRTAERPLPSGRVSAAEVFGLGALSAAVGVVYLGLAVNWLTALAGLLTWFLYVGVYTPMKARSAANTVVGAIAGAMPVLMGWTAAGAPLALSAGGLKAATLFLIVYLWQFPHFMAIAWIYRDQYASARLQMLTVVDPSGRRAGVQAVVAAIALVPVTLLPLLHFAGPVYLTGAVLLGGFYLLRSYQFFAAQDEESARRLLRTSLVYLPALLGLFMLVPLV